MLEQLLKILEGDCKKFKLKFEDKQYKLTLDDGKTFTGPDIEIVLNDAVGYGSEEHY